MRIVHTSDWHIGRYLQGVSLLSDQEHVLLQIVEFLREEKPDALIIAGDIYDKAIVTVESMQLLDEILSEIALNLQIPVIMIPGNHDSPGRVAIGSRLYEHHKLYIRSSMNDIYKPIEIEDSKGIKAHIYTIPFYDIAYYKEFLGVPELQNHNDVIKEIISGLEFTHGNNIAVLHHTISGSVIRSESERQLVIGGVEEIGTDLFDQFDYVAMGHFHVPQFVNRESINYSGSILKYSFDDSHEKSFSVINFDEHGLTSVERVPLVPKRDVRIIEGEFEDIVSKAKNDTARDDYIEARLSDKNVVFYPMERLKKYYPNLLKIRNEQLLYDADSSFDKPSIEDVHAAGPMEIIELFFKNVIDEKLTKDERDELIDIVNTVKSEEHYL